MDIIEQRVDRLADWIERDTSPARLRAILRVALRDAEARGEQRAAEAILVPAEGLIEIGPDEWAPADPAPEPVAAVEGPLNAHVGRRIPISALAAEEWASNEGTRLVWPVSSTPFNQGAIVKRGE